MIWIPKIKTMIDGANMLFLKSNNEPRNPCLGIRGIRLRWPSSSNSSIAIVRSQLSDGSHISCKVIDTANVAQARPPMSANVEPTMQAKLTRT